MITIKINVQNVAFSQQQLSINVLPTRFTSIAYYLSSFVD